jgi:hypothetical protein
MAHTIERYTAGDGTEIHVRFRRTSVEGVRGIVWCWKDAGAPNVDPQTGETNWSDESGPEPSMGECRKWVLECIAGWTL